MNYNILKLPKISALGHRAIFLALLLLGMLSPTALIAQVNVQGQWSTLPTSMPINPIHVALLPNGKVVIVAGSGNCPPSQGPPCPAGPPYGPSNNSGAAIYDPTTQTFTQFTLATDYFCNGMVLLPDGRAFIDGGTIQYDPFHGLSTSAIFDSATSTITAGKNMAHGRWYPTVVTLGNGQVMTFSGLDENGNTNQNVEIYNPAGTGSWSAQFPAPWTPPLYPWLHLLPNGNVFYSGPSPSNTGFFNPSTTTWTNVIPTFYGIQRTYGSSVLLPLGPTDNYDPKVMILGGNSPATNTTEIIDLGASNPTWVAGPNMSKPRIEMDAVILPNGKILAMGGSLNDEDPTTASFNADLYDPATNTFSSAGANQKPRLYHSEALLLLDATVWLAGGNPSRGTYEPTIEIYQPAYLFNPDGTLATRPSITGAPGSISWGSQFTVQTQDAANIGSVVLVRNGASTHAFNMDQRLVRVNFTAGSGALTVTAPPSANIAPPGYYMLFILNTSGVPSVAKELTVGTSGSPDFSLSATPSTRSVAAGGSTTYTVTVTPSGGFSGSVAFSASGLPSGAAASFSANPLTGGSGSSTMTVTTASGTQRGTSTYPLTITGTSGALSHSAPVTLTVKKH